MTEEEHEKMLEKMVQERYKPGSSFVTYAEDRVNSQRPIERSTVTTGDPILWKVKCMVCSFELEFMFLNNLESYNYLLCIFFYYFLCCRLGVRGIPLSALCRSMLIFSLWERHRRQFLHLLLSMLRVLYLLKLTRKMIYMRYEFLLLTYHHNIGALSFLIVIIETNVWFFYCTGL